MKVVRSLAAAAAASSCAFASAAFAQTPAAPSATGGSPFLAMMQGVFGLVVVVALIFAAAWLLRKVGPRAKSGGVVQVLGGASVGPREKVVVVRVADRTLVLGVAPGHVGLLHAGDGDGPTFDERLRAAKVDA